MLDIYMEVLLLRHQIEYIRETIFLGSVAHSCIDNMDNNKRGQTSTRPMDIQRQQHPHFKKVVMGVKYIVETYNLLVG
jgi:hypothetical protein